MFKTWLIWLSVLAGSLAGAFGLAMFGALPTGSHVFWRFRIYEAEIGVLGLFCLAASLAVLRNRKLACYLLLIPTVTALAADPFVRGEYWKSILPTPFIVILFALVVFWATAREWPNPGLPQSLWSRIVGGGIFLLSLMALISLGAIAITLRFPVIGDCGEGLPVARKYGKADFVARVIHYDQILGSVSVVQESFWGLPAHTRIVFLEMIAKPGDIWFVDARRGDGLLTRRLLPVMNMHCSRSGPIERAKVDLRAAREAPKAGVHIIGECVRFDRSLEVPAPGVKVVIAGPAEPISTTTDEDGIYDVSGLPPGYYTVRADVYNERFREYPTCPEYLGLLPGLKSGDVFGCKLRIN